MKSFSLSALTGTLLVAIAGSLPAQVTYTGSTRVFGQAASRQGVNQGLPASFARWELNSLLTVYGVPISVTGLLTSEQAYSDQQMNYFSIGLSQGDLQMLIRSKIDEKIGEFEAWKTKMETDGMDALRDSLSRFAPEKLKDVADLPSLDKLKELSSLKESDLQDRLGELKSMGIASVTQSITSLFPTLAVGTAFPLYSSLILEGSPVTGVDVEFTPGKFYTAFTAGKILTSTPGIASYQSFLSEFAYDRTLTAGRLGYGRKDDTHLFVTALYAHDKGGSPYPDSIAPPHAMQENIVVGTEGQLLLFDDRLAFRGEVAFSALENDAGALGMDSTSDVPSWMTDVFGISPSSAYDYAYMFAGGYSFLESGTTVSLMTKRVGPAYNSLGVPFIKNDYRRHEVKLEQGFLQRQLTVGGYYRREEDNLGDTKSSGTTTEAFGASLAMNFQNLPYLRVNYAPLTQQSGALADSLKIENEITVISAMTGYTARAQSGFVSSSNLAFVFQEGKTKGGIGAYISRNATFSQFFTFAIPLSLTLAVGSSITSIEASTTTVISTDLAASYAFGEWSTTLGGTFSRDAVKRNTAYVAASGPLGKIAGLTLQVERTNVDDPTYTGANFDETVFRMTLTRDW
jgi:hypothetical protein